MGQERTTMAGTLLVAMVVLSLAARAVDGQLSGTYYASTCPNVESIARKAFLDQVSFYNIASLPANILRYAFHDCAVDGCEGSVMLSGTQDGKITDEKNSFKNVGLGNLPVVLYMKAQIDAVCKDAAGGPVVSCSDVLALAGREAFNFAKGLGNLGTQIIPIPLGRKDGTSAQTSHADAQLLGPATSVDQLLANFGRIGLTTEQIVALIGSHTIGVAHCVNIVNRLYPNLDSTLSLPQSAVLAMKLKMDCPPAYDANTLVNNDVTYTIFDNSYFVNVMAGQGLMTIDDNLRLDTRTKNFVQRFATDQQHFYDVFEQAYMVLTSWQVLTGSQGQIRKDCTAVNS